MRGSKRGEGEQGGKGSEGARGSKGQGYVILGVRVLTTSVGARGEGEQGGVKGVRGSNGVRVRYTRC